LIEVRVSQLIKPFWTDDQRQDTRNWHVILI